MNSNTDPICIVAIEQMISSMHVMISRFMSNHDGDAVVDGRFVKFFLSCCNRFAEKYYGRQDVPFWANTGNFPSLLNLEEQIEKFGKLRWYWEGTRERFIQTVKKVLVSMRRSGSYFSKKIGAHSKIKRAGLDTKKKTEKKWRTYERQYVRYRSLAEIVEKI